MPPALAQLEDLDHTIEHGVVAVEDFIRETASKTRQREELNDRRIDEITNAVSGKVAGSLESRLEHLERTLDANLGQVRQIALWRRACPAEPATAVNVVWAPVPTRSHSRAVLMFAQRVDAVEAVVGERLGARSTVRPKATALPGNGHSISWSSLISSPCVFVGDLVRALCDCPLCITRDRPRLSRTPPADQAPGFPSSARRPCCEPSAGSATKRVGASVDELSGGASPGTPRSDAAAASRVRARRRTTPSADACASSRARSPRTHAGDVAGSDYQHQRTHAWVGVGVAQFHLSTDLSAHCLRTLNGAGTR